LKRRTNIAPRVLIASSVLSIFAPIFGEGRSYASARMKALLLVAGATCPYDVDGKRVDLTADTLLLVNPLVLHRPLGRRGAEPSLVLSLYMTSDWIEARHPGARTFGANAAPLDAATRAHLRRVTGLLGDVRSTDRSLFDATTDLAACVVDAHATQGPARPRLAFDYRIRRAIRVATANTERVATVADMIAVSEMSRSRFFELFEDCVGATPQVFLDAHAGEMVVMALAETDVTIGRLALKLGFANPDGFTRLVRRATGLTPRDFRRAASRL
jgi:AraC family transcriptional regulator